MRTLSRTERSLKIRMFWNVRATPARAIFQGGSPTRDRPWNESSPDVGR
jgi:hypothetical protein